MGRHRNLQTGIVVSVADEKDHRFGSGWEPADANDEVSPWASKNVADLKDEITRRNEGRDDADRLSLEGKKAELVAALDADDAK